MYFDSPTLSIPYEKSARTPYQIQTRTKAYTLARSQLHSKEFFKLTTICSIKRTADRILAFHFENILFKAVKSFSGKIIENQWTKEDFFNTIIHGNMQMWATQFPIGNDCDGVCE